MKKHEMKETQVAHILGITQSAVSKYSRRVRGTTIPIDNLPEIHALSDRMVAFLLSNPVNQVEVMKLFCQACTLIRSKHLMCPLCQQNHNPKIDSCDFCFDP
jgi:predicted transcriptional regulator